MDPVTLAILMMLLMFALLAIGLPIGFAMGLTGFLGSAILLGEIEPALSLLGQTAYETVITYNLSIVPLFILMGYFASNSGLSEALFKACNTWLGYRRGGLALATIGGCGAFAAVCGSSLATAATMTQVALPEMKRYKYSDQLATGSIAAGGTIGILIPPSVILVLYGILTESNIGELFLAGIVPGLLTVLFFMGTITVMTRIYPDMGPRGEKGHPCLPSWPPLRMSGERSCCFRWLSAASIWAYSHPRKRPASAPRAPWRWRCWPEP